MLNLFKTQPADNLKRYVVRDEGCFFSIVDKHQQEVVDRYCGFMQAIEAANRANRADKTGMIRKALTF